MNGKTVHLVQRTPPSLLYPQRVATNSEVNQDTNPGMPVNNASSSTNSNNNINNSGTIFQNIVSRLSVYLIEDIKTVCRNKRKYK